MDYLSYNSTLAMTKEEKVKSFDINGPAIHHGIFGLPFDYEDSQTIILPVPWEVTVSYSSGTANGPKAIKEASYQVDLYDALNPDSWKKGIFMQEADTRIEADSLRLREMAESYIDGLYEGKVDGKTLRIINDACQEMVDEIERVSHKLLTDGKKVILLGGDHSTPLGLIKALASRNQSFGILQIDAHSDLREAYEGFQYSHASIMANVMDLKQVERLVQVGVRDYCHEEVEKIESSGDRIVCFYDKDIKSQKYRGVHWDVQCENIVSKLPQKVYVSFDIDGLDPKLCPNTGTPVAGGFEAEEVLYLIEKIALSGRQIIGMDLNEVAPGSGEWDANVGARILYRLCNLISYQIEEN